MAAEFMHIGIPVTTKKPGMEYNEELKIWTSNPDDYEFKIEYLKFEEGTCFPEIMHKNPHVAYKVDDMHPYLNAAQSVIFPPREIGPGVSIAFITVDDTIIELFVEK